MYIIYHCSIVNMAIQKDKIESSSQIFFPFFFSFPKNGEFFWGTEKYGGTQNHAKR